MASKRELVEAHAFSRRRLVTAFLSGAPGGREVEPVRHGRAVIGGIAVSVLLLAGGAIAGFFSSPTAADWTSQGMVISKEKGTPYVILNDGDAPQRLVNVTSAMLLLGDDFEIRTVAQEKISNRSDGRSIGIYGAPDDPPEVGELVDTGWTACTASTGGLRLRIDDAVTTTAAAQGAVMVQVDKAHYLVVDTAAGAYRLALPGKPAARNNVATALRGVEDLGQVPARWVDLLPLGEPLTEAGFPVARRGDRADYLDGADLRIGDVVDVNGQRLLIGTDAPMPLDPFAEAVYRAVVASPEVVPSAPLGVASGSVPQSWPVAIPQPTPLDSDGDGAHEVCVVLDAEAGRAAVPRLAVDPSADASAAELSAKARVDVATGRGALVLSADHGVRSGGQPWLIDAWGRRYALGGPAGDTAERLGYGGHAPPSVAGAWIELVTDCGPELSQALAMGVPDLAAQGGSCG